MPDQKKFKAVSFLIIVCAVVVVGGAGYYLLTKQKNVGQTPPPQPSNTSLQTTTTVAPTQTTSASATLDQSSLTSTSKTPTITGTFANTTGLEIIITSGSLPTKGLLGDTIPGEVWNDRSDHGGNIVLQTTTKTFSNTVTTPLPSGTYTVGIYTDTIFYPRTDENLKKDYRELLSSDILHIY